MRTPIITFLAGMALGALASAGAPLVPETPLAPAPAAESPGNRMLTELAARRALEAGLPATAAALYRELLQQPADDRESLTLALVTALLDEGDLAGAKQELDGWKGPKGPAWQLRAGLVAVGLGEPADARKAVAGVKPDALPTEDRGWYYYLQGRLAGEAGQRDAARKLYQQAESSAGSDLARARFLLAREQAELRMGAPDAQQLAAARDNMARWQGRKVGYGFARTYAVMLAAAGRQGDAIEVLKQQLLALPAEERGEADGFRFMLGMIAGAESDTGRHALEVLLETGVDRDKQLMALALLARAATGDSARAEFRQELNKLTGMVPAHPLLEDLLLVRAQVALTAKDYAQAESDAHALLDKFPGSQLKAQAYGVLTAAAWQQYRYRSVADLAEKAREALARTGPASAELGVLVAEAWFRAGYYPGAADAYAAALRDVPAGVSQGDLMFQAVLANVEAGRLEAAEKQIDGWAADPAFDAGNRWRAEWNLSRALQAAGQTEAAYARVTNLLQHAPAQGLPAQLRAQMAWLQARLSLAAGKPEVTLELTDQLLKSLNGLPAALKGQMASTSELLRAEANFRLERKDAAVAQLKALRQEYPRTDAAVYSYIVEADYYAQQDQTVEAQRLFLQLADDFPDDKTYAPYALFRAAAQAERRGQDTNLVEANKLIEKLVTQYPGSPLVFYARLKQGDLLRKLNQFPQAQQVYENLVNQHPDHPDTVLAQLALAECHDAQAMEDPDHAERALTLFEHLRDRVDAPLDVRVEAGFNLGYLLERRGQAERAERVWWRDVVTAFLLNGKQADELGAKGRYWMTRTLLELGALYEKQARLDQAQAAWKLIIQTGLPGQVLARAQLARFNPAPGKP